MMHVREISADEYHELLPHAWCFVTAPFAELNKARCERCVYLLFEENKPRFGLILGIRGDAAMSPFSAPYGGLYPFDRNVSMEKIECAVDAFEVYIEQQGLKTIRWTLPPNRYAESFLGKLHHVLLRKSWELTSYDLDYVVDLAGFKKQDSWETLGKEMRKNLKSARNQSFQFYPTDDLDLVYDLILRNRTAHGYELSMTLEQIKQTAQVLRVEAFVLEWNQVPVASALFYRVLDTLPMLIFWGDLPEAHRTSMTYFAYRIFCRYAADDCAWLDLGTAMLNGAPNYGLCAFKSAIGGEVSPKLSFIKRTTL